MGARARIGDREDTPERRQQREGFAADCAGIAAPAVVVVLPGGDEFFNALATTTAAKQFAGPVAMITDFWRGVPLMLLVIPSAAVEWVADLAGAAGLAFRPGGFQATVRPGTPQVEIMLGGFPSYDAEARLRLLAGPTPGSRGNPQPQPSGPATSGRVYSLASAMRFNIVMHTSFPE